ncbi:DNA polymerase III subunit beta [Phytoactinopolyspora halotolerans]|uniref:Beta sliding clamp n=1 Tax=Phytoactinopolyspora halotolerans TaxID=1981512 RepID=A0A6L9S215_9ACTN|nr:DNA polymerase III subunit beta [Phytoactinopolyspora halotolerans]NED98703.1 DNA polymerase III subunit beta [Phytoactinopolyspora halotolerans]
MKFRLERDILAEAVAWAARTLPNRPTVPVLAGLRLDASDGEVAFSSFDYEVSGKVSVPAEVADPGTVLVSGKLLADIARSLPAKPVEFTADGSKVVITCGNARFTLVTLPVEEYPELPALPAASGTVDGTVFAEAISQVAVAAGRDDMLPTLTGIRIEIEGETVTLGATDRYRLAVRELTWNPVRPDLSAVALVPARTLVDAAKTLASTGEVTLALGSETDDSLIGLAAGGRHTTSRLIDGEWVPNYRRLFPAEIATVAKVEIASLIDSVKRVALVAERNTPIRLAFDDGQVVLEAGSGDDAQASEALQAHVDGPAIATGFNPNYLLDGLQALGTPFVHMSFTDTPLKPVVVEGIESLEAEPNSGYRYLAMPIRLSS